MSKIERALTKAEHEKRKLTEISRGDKAGMEPPAADDRVMDQEEPLLEGSQVSEHFRRIAARLKTWLDNNSAHDLLVTSAVSGEGKTTIAINSAIALCRDFNLSVCLVDCDLRNPSLSAHFSSDGSPGMTDVLKGKADINLALRPTLMKNLSIITSRKVNRYSLSLLNSDRLRRFVSEIKNRFDVVIYDTSPVLPVSDAAVLSKCLSGVVLVIESGKTRKKHIEEIFEQIDKKKFVGFIMNYKDSTLPNVYDYSKYYNYCGKI